MDQDRERCRCDIVNGVSVVGRQNQMPLPYWQRVTWPCGWKTTLCVALERGLHARTYERWPFAQ
jgi:hypothetical protein